MTPDLTDDDRHRFERLREQLDGVSTADRSEPRRMTSFDSFDPMLAETFDGDLAELNEDEWYAERKYDGTRLVLQKFDDEVKLYTRRHVERSETIPELTSEATAALPDGLVLDGEVTFLDPDGRSFFTPIHSSSDKVERYDLEQVYFVFDLLVEDSEWLRRRPLTERKERLHDVVPTLDVLEPVEAVTTGFQDFYDELVADEEEGIIIKRRDSPYHLDTRSRHWQKVKAFTQRDAVAVGYTRGEGQREPSFGALVLTDGERYIGRVGSGFSDRELELLMDTFDEVDSRPVPVAAVDATYQPIEPFVVSVKYQEVTRDGELRAPVYLDAKPDAPIDDVTALEETE